MDNRKTTKKKEQRFALRPASSDEAGLFYSQNEQDEALATVGHLRADFGYKGQQFWSTWWPHNGDRFNTPEFKREFDDFINGLRERGPLRSLDAMATYCGQHGEGKIADGRGGYGYIAESENYRYCLRCTPRPGDYQAYVYIYDLRQQELHMTEQAPSQKMTMGGM